MDPLGRCLVLVFVFTLVVLLVLLGRTPAPAGGICVVRVRGRMACVTALLMEETLRIHRTGGGIMLGSVYLTNKATLSFSLVDCPTQLTLYDLDLSVVFHDKYQ